MCIHTSDDEFLTAPSFDALFGVGAVLTPSVEMACGASVPRHHGGIDTYAHARTRRSAQSLRELWSFGKMLGALSAGVGRDGVSLLGL